MKIQRDNENGQSLVEFALVIPIFALILIGIVELGNIWMTMNVLTGASREGARVAAVTSPDTELVSTAVRNVLSSIGVTGETVTIEGPNIDAEVSVSVRITYTSITGGIIPGLAGSVELVRSTTMHWEG